MTKNVPDDVQKAIGQTSSIVTSITDFAATTFGGANGANSGNDIVNTAFNLVTCGVGTECYKSKQNDILKGIYIQNQKNLKNAPMDLSQAEKNYFVYNGGNGGGENVYNKFIIDRFAKTAEQFKKNSIDKQQQFMSDLLQSIKQYQAALMFQEQMANLLKTRQTEHADLMKNVNYYQKILQTSERKFVYENINMDSLYMYRRVMIFLYYAAMVCFIIFGNFIPDRLYSKWSVWLIIIIVAIIPIILNMLIMWLFIIYDTVSYWFEDLPHKDVYMFMSNPADEKPPSGNGPKPPIGG